MTDLTKSMTDLTKSMTDLTKSMTDLTKSMTDLTKSVTDLVKKMVKNRHLAVTCLKTRQFNRLNCLDARCARKETIFACRTARQTKAHSLSCRKTAIPLRPSRGKRTEVRWDVRFGFQNPSRRPSPRWDGARESFALDPSLI
jgi:hypothetical protein